MTKLYTSKVLAQWLNVTERRIRQLRDEGILNEEAPGLYNLHQSVVKYIGYLKHGSTELNDERTKLTKAKREAAETDNMIRKGELLLVSDVEPQLKDMLLKFRSRLLTIPAKLSPELAAMDGQQADIYDRLKEELDDTLTVFSDYQKLMNAKTELPDDKD